MNAKSIGVSYTRKDYLDDSMDWDQFAGQFADALKPLIYTILTETGIDAMREIGEQLSLFDPFSQLLRDYFTDRALKIAQDVNDETEKQLRAALSQGIQAGESSYELSARDEQVTGSASTMRADRIARTEVARAQGYADIQAWTQSGAVSGKEWYTAEDEQVCPFCSSLDKNVHGLEENVFSKGESLSVDGQTQHYNYDDVPSAPLHVNCRCALLPVRA